MDNSINYNDKYNSAKSFASFDDAMNAARAGAYKNAEEDKGAFSTKVGDYLITAQTELNKGTFKVFKRAQNGTSFEIKKMHTSDAQQSTKGIFDKGKYKKNLKISEEIKAISKEIETQSSAALGLQLLMAKEGVTTDELATELKEFKDKEQLLEVLNFPNSNGDRCLHLLLERDAKNLGIIMTALQKAGITKEDLMTLLQATNNRGETPLHKAAGAVNQGNMTNFINASKVAGIGVGDLMPLLQTKDNYGETPLHKAAKNVKNMADFINASKVAGI
ncbi:MAG: hypothetical protein LBI77_00295, partial [Puniceicoccales bacterium]|nr:hypothetical protein [Puniceicoccales bacterium]